MINKVNDFRNWCNANQGLLTFIFGIVAVLGLIPFNSIKFGNSYTFIEKIRTVLIYEIKIPVYLLIILAIISGIYFIKIKNRYKKKHISIDFLIGSWKNQWEINGQIGSEICEIKADGKYYISGEHWFTLTDFKYNPQKNEITFFKYAVKANDNRNLKNVLTINNNDFISGSENNYSIKYTRI